MMTGIKRPSVAVFALSELAALAAFTLRSTGRQVSGFTADDSFCDREQFEQLPVVRLSALDATFPPAEHEVYVAMGFRSMNQLRQKACAAVKARGYRLASFISKSASVWEGFVQPDHLAVYESVILQPFTQVGENVIIRTNVNLGHHTAVGDDVFLASGVVTGGGVAIGDRSVIGLGAVVRDGVRVAEDCFIGAGAVVLRDTEPGEVYVGNPARKLGKSSLEVTGG